MSSNPLDQKGIDVIQTATSEMNAVIGDGSKLVAILTAGFLVEGQKLIEKGDHPKTVVSRFEQVLDEAVGHLGRDSRKISENEIPSVTLTAACGDKQSASIIAEALRRAGTYGIVTIDAGNHAETLLENLRRDAVRSRISIRVLCDGFREPLMCSGGLFDPGIPTTHRFYARATTGA